MRPSVVCSVDVAEWVTWLVGGSVFWPGYRVTMGAREVKELVTGKALVLAVFAEDSENWRSTRLKQNGNQNLI